MITVEGLISLSVVIVTFIFGEITKKLEVEKNLIPVQNLVVGILAGSLVYMTGLSDNVFDSIILCLISAMASGGTYDLVKTKGDADGDK